MLAETFNLLHFIFFQVLTENKYGFSFLEEGQRIFNCDETGMEFDTISKFILAEKGVKFVPSSCRGMHERVSVLACANATGTTCIPHLFIFKSPSGQKPRFVEDGAAPDVMFEGQKSGWMTKDLYLKWFKERFLVFAPKVRPLILIFDGLRSHITLELINCAEENEILLVCLPAHSSHVFQPLDVSLFGPLKAGWRRVSATMNHFTGRVVNQFNFARLFRIAWDTTVDPGLISAGFQKTGLFPFKKTVQPPLPSESDSLSGLEQMEVADICILPERKKKERATRPLNPSGRLLNGTFLDELREDTKRKEELVKEKEEKKKQWEAEKKAKEEAKETKRKEREERKMASSSKRTCKVTIDQSTCFVCKSDDIDGDGEEIIWVNCDHCPRWFHQVCTTVQNTLEDFNCGFCT